MKEESFAIHYVGCDKPLPPAPTVFPCDLCGKLLFSDEHRRQHARKCRSNKWDIPLSPKKLGLPCYVCGNEYNTELSLERHIKACEKVWLLRQKDNPYPEERLPLPPRVVLSADADNEARALAKKTAMLGCGTMKQCEKCSRCFFADSWAKHVKGCGQEETIQKHLQREKVFFFPKKFFELC